MNAYEKQRKRELAYERKHRVKPVRMSSVDDDAPLDREPTDEEFDLVLRGHGDVKRENVRVMLMSGLFCVRVDSRTLRFYDAAKLRNRVREGTGIGVKVYAAGQTTTAVYDPKTKAPLVFKTGDARSQKAEIKAVMNSPEWKAAHKLPEDIEINVTE